MRILVLCLIILSQNNISAQQNSPPLFFDHLTINNALSHNTVFCILQDRDGYIWVGTQSGLNKYDGYNFQVFPSEAPNSRQLKGKVITALHEDVKGNLWVGTRKNGVSIRKRNSEEFKPLQISSVINGYEISAINHDQNDNIWIATVGAGIMKYNPETQKTTPYNNANSQLSSDVVFDVLADQYETIWVATDGAGLNILGRDGQFSMSHPMLPHQPNMSGYRKTLLADGEHLWLGTEGTGLYKIHIKSKAYTHYNQDSPTNAISSTKVRDIVKASDGLLYIATDGNGLNVFDEIRQQMYAYNYQIDKPNSLNSNALFSFCEDRTGNIWIGTFNGGINIVKKNKTWFEYFTPTIGHNNDLGHRSVLAIHQIKEGNIWVGTDGGGLYTITSQSGDVSFSQWTNPEVDGLDLRNSAIKAIFEDQNGRLWISIYGNGLYLFDPDDNSFTQQNINGNNIWSVTGRKDGSIWVATLDQGLFILKPQNNSLRNYTVENVLPNEVIMVIYTDDSDHIWIGTAENGLYFWEDTAADFTTFQHYTANNTTLSSNDIRAIYQDHNGRLWIGTESGGLNQCLDNHSFKSIGIDQGLIANSVMGITEDQEGFIWVSTFRGLSRLNPDNLAVRSFNFHSKENSNQFNQMASITTTDGQLLFGGINGLNAIRLNQLKESNNQAKLIFTDLRIFNKSISSGLQADQRIILPMPIEQAENIYLNYTDNSFSIEFTAIDYTNPQEHLYLYKMEGFDSDWQVASNGQHSANYTNLDHGVFTFIVRFGEKTASLKVHIKPPFWDTYWFRIMALMLFSVTIIALVRFLLRRREQQHKQVLLKAESEILHLKNKNLLTEVNAQNSKLLFSSAQIAQRNELLSEIKGELKSAQQQSKINFRQLMFTIDRELKNEDYWDTFNQYVENVDQTYVQHLLSIHPQLTQNDLRLCILLRMNLSTKEIAALLNVSIRAVEQSRYRLKKRLGLSNDTDLVKYITRIKPQT